VAASVDAFERINQLDIDR
jgi:hypothetical protein